MIRTRMTCYRLFENERGFRDFERYPEFDREVSDDTDAVTHMADCIEWEGRGESFVFRVESWEDDRSETNSFLFKESTQ